MPVGYIKFVGRGVVRLVVGLDVGLGVSLDVGLGVVGLSVGMGADFSSHTHNQDPESSSSFHLPVALIYA